MNKVKHKMTFRQCHVVGRNFTGQSLTVPDQTYTIRELMERAACGASPGVERQVYYDEVQDVDELLTHSGVDLSTLDLVELEEYRDSINQRISDLKAKATPAKSSAPEEPSIPSE